ncbi:hypothetical protein D030_1834A, partial [Vibrio parahaemolyticus AQ3810]
MLLVVQPNIALKRRDATNVFA